MTPFNIIVAIDENRGIGKGGALPWHLPGDLKYFKKMTIHGSSDSKQNAVIMGRKTWESIPEKFRPLSGRMNLVLTRNPRFQAPEGVLTASSLQDALQTLDQLNRDQKIQDIFVIGGEQVFKESMNLSDCRQLFVTHILETYSCDTHFPDYAEDFEQISSSERKSDDSTEYYYAQYLRKSFK